MPIEFPHGSRLEFARLDSHLIRLEILVYVLLLLINQDRRKLIPVYTKMELFFLSLIHLKMPIESPHDYRLEYRPRPFNSSLDAVGPTYHMFP